MYILFDGQTFRTEDGIDGIVVYYVLYLDGVFV